MIKAVVIAALALTASAGWVINPLELYKGGIVKSAFLGLQRHNLRVTPVFASCADEGHFTLDTANTHSVPTSVGKGMDVKLDLAGQFTAAYTLNNVHINVLWNGSTLYNEDHKKMQPVQGAWTDELGWTIPSYAPSGHYHVTITAIDNANNKNAACIQADFDL